MVCMLRVLSLAALVALLLVPAAVRAQEPSGAQLEDFVRIFIALQENAHGLSAETPAERRAGHEIIEAHDWTLEEYNRTASVVNGSPALYERFRALLAERGCAGLVQRPPQPCR